MATLDVPPSKPPPPPPPKRLSRPKITIQIPDSATPTTPKVQTARTPRPHTGPVYWAPPRYHGKVPGSPGSHISDPQMNPFVYMYHNKASDFMFKQFEGFKDFTMNTAKSGLSAGEKTAFWFYNKLRTLSKKWFTHLFLSLCLALYSVMGAAIFMALEGPNEDKYDKNLTDVRKDFAIKMELVWKNSTLVKNDDFNFFELVEKDFQEYENSFTAFMKHINSNDTHKKTWGFWNAMFYAGTIYTTIGYGHIAPKTTYGRVATIVYAIIGIPLFLIVLADFGKLFTRIIKFFWAFIRRFYYTRSCRKVRRTAPMQEVMKGLNIMYDVVRRPSQIFSEEDMEGVTDLEGHQPPPVERKESDAPPPLPPKPGALIEIEKDLDGETPAPSVFEIDDEFNLPISVAIFILVVYIIIGAIGYNCWESWDFFESFYFVFISMSTIGLGDLVPDHPMFMMASILYLVFGLALTSMCINVVQVKLSNTFKQASAKLGATIGLQVAEEDGSLVPMNPPLTEIVPVHKPKSEKENAKSKENNENDSDIKNR